MDYGSWLHKDKGSERNTKCAERKSVAKGRAFRPGMEAAARRRRCRLEACGGRATAGSPCKRIADTVRPAPTTADSPAAGPMRRRAKKNKKTIGLYTFNFTRLHWAFGNRPAPSGRNRGPLAEALAVATKNIPTFATQNKKNLKLCLHTRLMLLFSTWTA